MSEISTELIKNAIYKLCFEANTCLNDNIYSKIIQAYKTAENPETRTLLKNITENAQIAYNKKIPLCQDTGQVIVFLEIGQDVHIKGDYISDAVNSAVKKCYEDNFFRKSVVKNALFDRDNTKTNTPVVIHTEIIQGENINIKILIKGAGSENKSKLEMLLPTTDENEFIKIIGNLILSAEENACPPMFIGIGTGLTADGAMILSKKALVQEKFSKKESELAEKIKEYINLNAPEKYKDCYVLDIKLLTAPTHIACLPAAITINCHSSRFSQCSISENEIIYNHKIPNFNKLETNNDTAYKEISAQNITEIKKLKQGEQVLITGEIYVARDMAHKKLVEMINNGTPLPFDIENKIIFYAGPCPAKGIGEIGAIGPTTASRMDKFASVLYNKGLIATIGKGSRNNEIRNVIQQTGAKYLSCQGGIAALLSQKVKQSSIIAFHELGAEALYKIYVDKFPVKVELA